MAGAPQVEIRVPVSPTTEFALMLRVLHRSLARHGGLDRPRLTAMIGAPPEEHEAALALAEWLAPDMHGVVVDPQAFLARGVHATAQLRLTEPSDAEVVVLMDADLVVCGSLVDVCRETRSSGAVAGVIAHLPPNFSSKDWARVYAAAQLDPPAFPYRYSGWPDMFPKRLRRRPDFAMAPPYYNYAFVATTPEVLAELGRHHDELVVTAARSSPRSVQGRWAHRRTRAMFTSQIALTLAIERAGLEHRELGMRYNFANDRRLEALQASELDDARVIHLHRRDQGIDKRVIYRSVDGLRQFVAAEGTAGAADVARRVVAEILPDLEDVAPPTELAQPDWIW